MESEGQVYRKAASGGAHINNNKNLSAEKRDWNETEKKQPRE